MNRFKKKPVIVEAFQLTKERRSDNSEWPSWLHDAWQLDHEQPRALYPKDYPNSNGQDELMINTLEGPHLVSFNDFIIQGVKGEIYPCKPDIFHLTYEAVL